jgi:hypothetical protein
VWATGPRLQGPEWAQVRQGRADDSCALGHLIALWPCPARRQIVHSDGVLNQPGQVEGIIIRRRRGSRAIGRSSSERGVASVEPSDILLAVVTNPRAPTPTLCAVVADTGDPEKKEPVEPLETIELTPAGVLDLVSFAQPFEPIRESRLCGRRYRHVGGRPVLGERWGRVRRARGRPGAALGGSRARGGGYYPETDRCGVTLDPYGVTLAALTGGLRLQADSTAAGGSSQILLDPPLSQQGTAVQLSQQGTAVQLYRYSCT